MALLDWCQDEEVPLIYASSAAVYGGGQGVPRGARARGAAERLRLLEVPVRPGGAPAHAATPSAQVAGLRYFNVYGPSEAHKGAHGLGRVAFLQPVPRRGPRCKLFQRHGRLRRRRAAARFRLGRGRGRGEPVFPRATGADRASSTSAPDARRRSTTSPSPRSTPAARVAARPPLTLDETAGAGAASSTSRFPTRSRASTRATPRPTSRALRARRLRRRRS